MSFDGKGAARVLSADTGSFDKLVDNVRDLYKTKVGSFVIVLINAIVCAYTALIMTQSGYFVFSLVPMVVFLLNSLYLYSLVRPVKKDPDVVVPEVVEYGK